MSKEQRAWEAYLAAKAVDNDRAQRIIDPGFLVELWALAGEMRQEADSPEDDDWDAGWNSASGSFYDRLIKLLPPANIAQKEISK